MTDHAPWTTWEKLTSLTWLGDILILTLFAASCVTAFVFKHLSTEGKQQWDS